MGVSESLSNKEANIGSAKDRALNLQRRASTLSNSASQKLSDLLDMEKQYEENQRELDELSGTLKTMNCQMLVHLKTIQAKSNFYTACTPPSNFQPKESCDCSGAKPSRSARHCRSDTAVVTTLLHFYIIVLSSVC